MATKSSNPPPKLVSCEFEVFGTVQKVYFRKHTKKQCTTLGVQGWCMNTEKGTVVGTLEGPVNKVNQMKQWLQYIGSPNSKIDRAEFKNEKEIKTYSFKGFTIRR